MTHGNVAPSYKLHADTKDFVCRNMNLEGNIPRQPARVYFSVQAFHAFQYGGTYTRICARFCFFLKIFCHGSYVVGEGNTRLRHKQTCVYS